MWRKRRRVYKNKSKILSKTLDDRKFSKSFKKNIAFDEIKIADLDENSNNLRLR